MRAADRTDASRLLAAARELGRDYIQAGEILLVEDTHGKGTSPTTAEHRLLELSSRRLSEWQLSRVNYV